MFEMVGVFKEAGQKIGNLIKGVNYIIQTEVVVGIPKDSNTARDGITNAELMYIHENGSPARNIPPRPALKIGLSDETTRNQIRQMLLAGMRTALTGDVDNARKSYEKAGMVATSSVKKVFGKSPPLAPNSPVTIARKGSSAPLIDTGALQSSITYAVRKKGS